MFKLIRYLKNYKLQSIIAPLFKMIEAFFELVLPLVVANIIDVGIKNNDSSHILKMGGVMVLFGFLGLLCSITAQYFAAKASYGFGTEIRHDMFRHINSFTNAEIDKFGSSTLVTRITSDVNQAQSGVNMILRLFLRAPIIVVGAIFMAFSISHKITVIFVIAALLQGIIIYLIMSSNVPKFKKIQQKQDRITLMTRENLEGARVIRAFSRQADEDRAFKDNAEELKDLQIKAGRIQALMNPGTNIVVYAAIIAIMWFGGISVDFGTLTQGEVVALLSYMNQILLAFFAVANLIVSITKGQASAERINEVFAVKPSFSDNDNSDVTAQSDCVIEFDNVTFAYNSVEHPVLSDISFKVKKGETIGIIGGTGSGKSSLLNLIPRFYQCQQGSIYVDGENVNSYPFEQLRRKFGIVPQKAVLFKGTLRENMQWRKKDATDEEIISALKIAQAWDFVEKKGSGLDLKISQGGRNLSGGQRQRLTIARALVGNPEILMLDDSASALDLATESHLRKALAENTSGMTVLISSQRVSSIRNADKIIILDEGKIAGIGKHDELIKTCKVYKEICNSQMYNERGDN
ncbi:MAG: ABC transporter ATP-binding protein [Oscillospiraceae bacterium]